MKHLLKYFISSPFTVETEKKNVSVKEGNTVPLKTGSVEIQRDDEVVWMFGPQELAIAKIPKKWPITFHTPMMSISETSCSGPIRLEI